MTQAMATTDDQETAVATTTALPSLVRALHEQDIPRGMIRHRLVDKKSGRQAPYLPWRSVARVLDVVTVGHGGTWHTEIVSTGSEGDTAVVVVRLIIVSADGGTSSRSAVGTASLTARNADSAPPLECAERAAFKRAAAMFGIACPEEA